MRIKLVWESELSLETKTIFPSEGVFSGTPT